jgi:Ca2+-dependent lipid-binding protein
MEGMMYPLSLVVIALLAFFFNQSNNSTIVLILIVFGIYIVYSHETGNTATDFKNDLVEEVNEASGYDSKKPIF